MMKEKPTEKPSAHDEKHLTHRAGWIRAAVLGANDGIVSVASLVVGVAAAAIDRSGILLAGVAGLCAGAFAMASGEYVSVSSQADVEKADLEKEKSELERIPDIELKELAEIYEWRGLPKKLAHDVAVAMTKHNALEAHARDELGITNFSTARPLQAAIASAISFAIGAAMPLLVVIFVARDNIISGVMASTILALGLLGAAGAKLGGGSGWLLWRAVARVIFWGVIAMAVTLLVGKWFGGYI
ncbi:MAG: VIT1/CCC1 transporter family protein [Alphaproteobacteria bacterium]